MAHLIICWNISHEVLSHYEFIKWITLSWIQKKTPKVAENDNNNKRGRDDVTRFSVLSSIETRGRGGNKYGGGSNALQWETL